MRYLNGGQPKVEIMFDRSLKIALLTFMRRRGDRNATFNGKVVRRNFNMTTMAHLMQKTKDKNSKVNSIR